MRALVDTGALLALSFARDQHHARAIAIAGKHLAVGGRYFGTTLILSEFYSHLLYLRGPVKASAALGELLDDPAHEWVEVGSDLVVRARRYWLDKFNDQPMSLVDAVSFEVMRQRKAKYAFAFDRHFEIAGFRLLD